MCCWFSDQYLLAGNYTSVTKTPVYYTFNGEQAGQLSAEGVNPTGYGFRKFATDEQGKVLALSLGMSGGEQWIYKWDNVAGKGSEYISFSKASLGLIIILVLPVLMLQVRWMVMPQSY